MVRRGFTVISSLFVSPPLALAGSRRERIKEKESGSSVALAAVITEPSVSGRSNGYFSSGCFCGFV